MWRSWRGVEGWGLGGRGCPVESERQHQQHGGSQGGGLFPSIIKERIHRAVLWVCNAALRIKEEQSARMKSW